MKVYSIVYLQFTPVVTDLNFVLPLRTILSVSHLFIISLTMMEQDDPPFFEAQASITEGIINVDDRPPKRLMITKMVRPLRISTHSMVDFCFLLFSYVLDRFP